MMWKKNLRTSLRNADHAKYLTFFMKHCYTVTLLLKGCAAIKWNLRYFRILCVNIKILSIIKFLGLGKYEMSLVISDHRGK